MLDALSCRAMTSIVLRLAMLLALALMPFSMAAPAAAALSPAAGSEHCADHQKPVDAPVAPKAHCAACAALPAMEAPCPVEELRPTMQLVVAADRWITERGPETATPPPKNG
jgi:hypothetical protein